MIENTNGFFCPAQCWDCGADTTVRCALCNGVFCFGCMTDILCEDCRKALKTMIANVNGFFCLTPAEFAAQCEAVNTVPRLCTCAEANDPAASGLRAWPSGLLPWTAGDANVHVLAWPDGKCMVSQALWVSMGGAA